jgi:hypothetical protein
MEEIARVQPGAIMWMVGQMEILVVVKPMLDRLLNHCRALTGFYANVLHFQLSLGLFFGRNAGVL